MDAIVIGVLSLQGDFAKHIEMLLGLGVTVKEVRTSKDLEECDGLIIPGGESTVIMRQLNFIGMREKLVHFANYKPVFGTCAGLILMSQHIQDSNMNPLQILSVNVERNAFGRQIESFQVPVELHLEVNEVKIFPAFFIRAPRIRTVNPSIEILATYQGEPVLVRQGLHLGATFHPELTADSIIHRYFLDIVKVV